MPANKALLSLFTPIIHKVFRQLHNHLKRNGHARTYFDTPADFSSFMEEQHNLFVDLFFASNTTIQDTFTTCAKRYYNTHMTLIDLTEILHYIRRSIYKELVRKNQLNQHFIRCSGFFVNIRQGIAKGYLLEEIKAKELFYQNEFNQALFYKVHIRWMLSLLKAITTSTPNSIANFHISQCNFTQLLDMPITEMLLKDKGDKAHLMRLNQELHVRAKGLIHHVHNNFYYEAYMNFVNAGVFGQPRRSRSGQVIL